MNETVYSVALRYRIDDKAAASVKKLTRDVEDLGGASHKVVGLIAGIGGAFFGLESAKKHLIGFNSEVENAKISLSAMIEGNFGGSWDRAQAKATGLYNEFQKFSTQTPVTTKEILEFGQAVASSTFQAGGSIKDMTNVTEQGVVAAKAFGEDTAGSAMGISEMLNGAARKTNRTVAVMLGLMHKTSDEFNAMAAPDRLGAIKQVLNSDAIKDAAKAYSTSWSGVTSTLEDKGMIIAGKMGAPLFEALKKEMMAVSGWLDTHTEQVDAFAKRFGASLVSGFEAMRSGIGFLVDHADTLLKIGELYAAIKIGGMLGGSAKNGISGGAGKISSLLAWGRGARDSFDENGKYQYQNAGAGRQNVSMKNVGGSLPLLGQSLAAGYAIGSIFNQETGASAKLADSFAHLTGRVDETTDAYERQVKSSDLWKDAMDKRRDQGAKSGGFSGTTFNSNLLGTIDKYKADVAAGDKLMWAVNKYGVNSAPALAANKAYEDRGLDAKTYVSEKQNLPKLMETQTQVMRASLDQWYGGILKLNDTQLKALDVQQAQEEYMQYIASTMTARQTSKGYGGMAALSQGVADQAMLGLIFARNSSDKLSGKPNVNITIQRIEVQSDDPDRYAFGLVEAFRDAVKNPSAAARAAREG